MRVDVENAPDRIVGEIFVLLPIGPFLRLFLIPICDLHKCLWNTVFFGHFDRDPRVAADALLSTKVFRFRYFPFTND